MKTFHSQIDSKHCSSVWRSSFPDHLGICWKLYTLPETPNHLVCTLPLFLSVTVPKIAVPNSALECFSKRWWKTWVVVNVVQWPVTVPWKKTTSLCNLLLTLSLHNQTHAKPFYNQPGNLTRVDSLVSTPINSVWHPPIRWVLEVYWLGSSFKYTRSAEYWIQKPFLIAFYCICIGIH